MSTSILYHAFGLKGIEYKSTHFIADRIVISAEMKDQWVKPVVIIPLSQLLA